MDRDVAVALPNNVDNSSIEYKILNLEKEAENINSTFSLVTEQINLLQIEQQKLKQKVYSIKNQLKTLVKQLIVPSSSNKRKQPIDGFSQDLPSFSQNTFPAAPAHAFNSVSANSSNDTTMSEAAPVKVETKEQQKHEKEQLPKEKIDIRPTILNNNSNLCVLPDLNPKLFSIEIKDEILLQKLDYLLFEKNWRSEPTNQFFFYATSVIESYFVNFLPHITSSHSTLVLKLSNLREKELSTNNFVQIKDVYLLYHKGLCFSENKVNIDNLQFWHEKKLKTSTMIGNVQLWSTTVRSRVEDKSNQLFGFISSRRVAHLPSSPLWLLYYFPKNMWQNSTGKTTTTNSSPSHVPSFVSPPHNTSSAARGSPPHFVPAYEQNLSTSLGANSISGFTSTNTHAGTLNSSPLAISQNQKNNQTIKVNNDSNLGFEFSMNSSQDGSEFNSFVSNFEKSDNSTPPRSDFRMKQGNSNIIANNNYIASPSLSNSSFNKIFRKSESDGNSSRAVYDDKYAENSSNYHPLFQTQNAYFESPYVDYQNTQIDSFWGFLRDYDGAAHSFESFGVSSIGQDFAHYAIADNRDSQEMFIAFNKAVNDLSIKRKDNKDRVGERGGVIGIVGRNTKGKLLYTHNTTDSRCTHLTVTSPKYGFMSGKGDEADGIATADVGVIVVGVQVKWDDKRQQLVDKACSDVEPGKHVLVASGHSDFLTVSIPMSELNSVSLSSVVAVPLQSSSLFQPDENGVIWISAFVHSTPTWLLSFLSRQPTQSLNNSDEIAKMIEISCAKEMEAKYQHYSKTLADQLKQLHLSTHQTIIDESKANVENQLKLLTESLSNSQSLTSSTSETLSARLSAIEKMFNSELIKCIGDLSWSIKQSPSLISLASEKSLLITDEEKEEIESNFQSAVQEFETWKKLIDLSLSAIGKLKKSEMKDIERIKEKLKKGIEHSHSPSLFLYTKTLVYSATNLYPHLSFLYQALKLYGIQSNLLSSTQFSQSNFLHQFLNEEAKEESSESKEKIEAQASESSEANSITPVTKDKTQDTDGQLFVIFGLIEYRLNNQENAFKFFKKGAECENEESCFYLAECYYHSHGIAQNIKKAKKIYARISCNLDIPQASSALGLIYYFGIGEELPNYLEAEKLFQFAVDYSPCHSDAAYFLGMIKLHQKDYQSALVYLNMASDQSHPKAQYQLALLYYEGNQFIAKNNEKAKKFLKLSYQQKYLPSICAMSLLEIAPT